VYSIPTATTQEEIAFRNAYDSERKRQELAGVVCIYPEDIKKWMPSLSGSEFEELLQRMIANGFVWIAKGSIKGKPRIVCWIS
jgi:hypothetical protein